MMKHLGMQGWLQTQAVKHVGRQINVPLLYVHICCVSEPLCIVLMRCPIYRDESFHLCAASHSQERERLYSRCNHVAHGCWL